MEERMMDTIVEIYNHMDDRDKDAFTLGDAEDMVEDQIRMDKEAGREPLAYDPQFSTIPLWNSWSRTQSDVHSAWYSGQKIVYFSRLLSFAPDGNMHIPKGESPKGKTKTRRNSP